jgi:hypothetical protein
MDAQFSQFFGELELILSLNVNLALFSKLMNERLGKTQGLQIWQMHQLKVEFKLKNQSFDNLDFLKKNCSSIKSK